jgi:hypothetical protein
MIANVRNRKEQGMFLISMPLDFKVGGTAQVRINKKPATLFWRDANTLVVNGADSRRVLHSFVQDERRHFSCTDSDGWPSDVEVHTDALGNVTVEAKE